MVLVAVAVAVAVIADAPAAAADQRYRDKVFASGDIEVTTGVVFAAADPAAGLDTALRLDLYRSIDDTAGGRPVVIWVHGGGFISGDRGQMAAFARDSAQRGFVAASIDYRQLGETAAGLVAGVEDARRAVRWFRAHAAELGIDVDRISVGGYSAGAVTALNSAYSGTMPADRGAAERSDIASAISFAGASAATITPGEPPAVFFHGDRDPRVWYDAGPGQPLPGFSAVEVCERARAVDVVCEFHTHEGGTHLLTPYRTEDLEATARFLSCHVGAAGPFTDTEGRWYADDAAWASREEVVQPLGDGTFRGKNRLTRGQFVDLLWRLLGRPQSNSAHPYPDVPDGAWFEEALDWAAEAGAVPDYPGGRFRPHRSVTRGQAVDQLWTATGATTPWPAHSFPDVAVSAFPGTALDWAAANDIVRPYPDGTFRRAKVVNRAQAVGLARRVALTASAWSDPWRVSPPETVCFREGDPERLG